MKLVGRRPKRTTRFLAWSIAIHLSLAFLLWRRDPPPARVTAVEVEYTNPVEPTPAPSLERKSAAPKAPTVPRQIVEQEKRLNDEIDANTRFLSAFDQKVMQQTRAEHVGKFENQVHGAKATSRGAEHAPETRAATARTTEHGEVSSLGQLLPKYDQPGSNDRVASAAPDGDPTRTDDYLKDVRPGLQTLISTREFVYYAYYNRIKAALRSHWEPEVREKVSIVLRQGRGLAAAHDRVTQVVVTLDARGELIAVTVLSQSGITEVDDAAVNAFRRAAPFPNPPRGMVEVDGTVKIRWDFVLEV